MIFSVKSPSLDYSKVYGLFLWYTCDLKGNFRVNVEKICNMIHNVRYKQCHEPWACDPCPESTAQRPWPKSVVLADRTWAMALSCELLTHGVVGRMQNKWAMATKANPWRTSWSKVSRNCNSQPYLPFFFLYSLNSLSNPCICTL